MSEQTDAAYNERNQLVALLASMFPSGIKRTAIDGWDPAWHNCVYLDLPTGQASWHYHDREAHLFSHLPPYEGEWDGHATPQKYERLAALKLLLHHRRNPLMSHITYGDERAEALSWQWVPRWLLPKRWRL